MVTAMALLAPAECQRIEVAIAELEKRTEAELVVAVVGRSTQTTVEHALFCPVRAARALPHARAGRRAVAGLRARAACRDLGDKAIDARVGQSGWQAHIDQVVAAIRRGEAASGILAVLERLGVVLAEVAPAGEQNEDELPNTVIQEP
jgi:uncharacterized membrane protein